MVPRHLFLSMLAVVAITSVACSEAGSAGQPSSPPPEDPAEFLETGQQNFAELDAPSSQPTMPAPRSGDLMGMVVRARKPRLKVWSGPSTNSRATRIDGSNPWDQEIAFPVREVEGKRGRIWYRILLGIAPNGSSGWVRLRDVSVEQVRHRIIVDLSTRTLMHYRGRALRHRFRVGIGKPETPTTEGRFFVWAHLDPQDESGPYGSYLLGLSGFSEVLSSWPGGGRMAIHGTDVASDRGSAVSFGCPRVLNRQMDRLQSVPMGTTVLIRR